jgi:hypothetical protein
VCLHHSLSRRLVGLRVRLGGGVGGHGRRAGLHAAFLTSPLLELLELLQSC